MRAFNIGTPAVLKFGSRGQIGVRPVWSHVLNRLFHQGGTLMCALKRPRLTPRDFAILETMLADHLGGDELLIAAIRKKLERAKIVFADDLPGDVATIGSRLAFTVDEQWPQERRLVTLEHYVPGQDHQSVTSRRPKARHAKSRPICIWLQAVAIDSSLWPAAQNDRRETIPVHLPLNFHCPRAVRPMTNTMAIGRKGNPLALAPQL